MITDTTQVWEDHSVISTLTYKHINSHYDLCVVAPFSLIRMKISAECTAFVFTELGSTSFLESVVTNLQNQMPLHRKV